MTYREQQQEKYHAYIDCMNMRTKKRKYLISQFLFNEEYKTLTIKEISEKTYCNEKNNIVPRKLKTKVSKNIIKQMFELLSNGYQKKEIAQRFNVSISYLKYHENKWQTY
tara:strand:- start:289 stop:618 length:330 start_codon:yes stop_codon:yes gene_type:complete